MRLPKWGLALQAKLLRVLQEREVERLGGSKVIPLNVRILATTNRDIHKAVEDGEFREDLFYRLNVFPLNIAPLRERTGDILPLANRMLLTNSNDRQLNYFSESAINLLNSHFWPGNVRELDNVVQRALILKSGNVIDANDIQFEHKADHVPSLKQDTAVTNSADSGLSSDLKARETDLIISALKTKNSRLEVAEKLGISPRTLRYKLAKLRDSGVALPA